jgi:hypothetical protein
MKYPKTMDLDIARLLEDHNVNDPLPPLKGITMFDAIVDHGHLSCEKILAHVLIRDGVRVRGRGAW